MTASAPPPAPPRGSDRSPVYRSPREEFRRARTRSQTVVFGAAIIGLGVLALLGFLGVSGALPMPFGDDFSREEVFAETGEVPCPTQGARMVAPAGVAVRVLNTTSTPGLAGSVATSLEELGYTIAGTDNGTAYHGVARIQAGPNGVDAAYSLARFIPGTVKIILSADEDATVTLSLGTKFEGLIPAEERAGIAESNSGLTPIKGCVPLGDIPPIPQSGEQSGAQSGAQSGTQSGESVPVENPAEAPTEEPAG